MVCVIWTESPKAHEMQPGPLGGLRDVCTVGPVCLCI